MPEPRLLLQCLAALGVLTLAACGSAPNRAGTEAAEVRAVEKSAEQVRIEALENLLQAQRQHCLEEKRQLEASNRDQRKKLDETQKKLDALIAIERDMRRGTRK